MLGVEQKLAPLFEGVLDGVYQWRIFSVLKQECLQLGFAEFEQAA